MFATLARRLATAVPRRGFAASVSSEGSHADFQPQRKEPKVGSTQDDETQAFISKAVKEDPVVLFMKGTPDQPMCGFSRTVVQVLRSEGARFAAYNVLESDSLRNGIKVFTGWPTIPQLFVKGEFVGGADITVSMHQSGELKQLLDQAGALKKAA